MRQGSLAELASLRGQSVSVRTPQADKLVAALQRQEITAERLAEGQVRARGASPAEVGHVAFTERIELHELASEGSPLEDAFFALTEDAADPGRREES